MRTLLRLVAAATLAMLLAGSAHASKPGFSRDFETLAGALVGTFMLPSPVGDPATLHVIPVWTDRIDARWFYAEQSVAGRVEHQAMLRLMENEQGAFECAEFALPSPARFAGARDLEQLPADSLQARPGCALYLKKQKDGSFAGNARSPSCVSVLRGATDPVAELRVDGRGLTTRGWAGSGPNPATPRPVSFARTGR